jgi:energy-converting hydrogenase Eha subunit F
MLIFKIFSTFVPIILILTILNEVKMEDKHVIPIPPAVLADAQSLIDEANAILSPYLLPLTPAERHNMAKMGDKTLSFVEKAQDYAHQYPQFCPSYLNVAAFDTDMTDATGLRTVHITAKQLSDNIDDTVMVAGSEAYQAALTFYNAVKAAAVQDIPGAKEVYNDLKARFPSIKRKKDE